MPDRVDPPVVTAQETLPDNGPPAVPTGILESLEEGRIDVRSFATRGLVILAVLYTLYFAKPFLLPIVLAVLLALLLRPFVRGLRRLKVPEPVGAAIVVLGLMAVLAGGIYGLIGPAAAWIDDAPNMASQIRAKVGPLIRPVEQVSEATAQVEQQIATKDDTVTVQLKQPGLSNTLLTQAESFIAVGTVVVILMYFLLASGDMFLRKLVKVLPNFQEKKRAIEIAKEIQQGVSNYLITVSMIYTGLGVAVTIALFFLGMPNPILWGVVAGALNFIPYLGALVTMVVLTAVAILSFDSIGYALLVPATFVAISTVEGYIVTPTIVGRRLTLNPVVIFIAMTFWWWLWGIVGALLAVPLLAVMKILCEHVEPLNPIAEFLGE